MLLKEVVDLLGEPQKVVIIDYPTKYEEVNTKNVEVALRYDYLMDRKVLQIKARAGVMEIYIAIGDEQRKVNKILRGILKGEC